jgi:hypothetical protein
MLGLDVSMLAALFKWRFFDLLRTILSPQYYSSTEENLLCAMDPSFSFAARIF